MSEEFKKLEETLGTVAMAQRERASTYLQSTPQRIVAAIPRYVPIVKWLPEYPRANLRSDFIAGLTVWGVGIPTAMAYAGIAGVPPEAGLYSALVALALYGIFSSSRHVKVTLIGDLKNINIQVLLAQVRGAARERMRRTGLMELVGEENIFLSVEGAVHFFEETLAQKNVTTAEPASTP